ncbi:MAG: 2-amino-4-hydroxy-6-hydroxymethyldihydropteridine diphosphokinase [Desulfuromonadales bacterium]|nr:2-amino-4-hydroxy-6-hydroxymethyldihydropteridine diphosphokinase [Desulfuromonadales bacterium]
MNEQSAYLGFGSNLGDCLSTLREARQLLHATPGIRVIAVSALYHTTPVGGPLDQPNYLNGVIAIGTTLEPLPLLHCCQQLEERFGRKRAIRWEARTLDIDLLLYADQVIDTIELQLPHPRISERGFVLQPLCDLAADHLHPVLQTPYAVLLEQISPLQGVLRLQEVW